MLRLLMSMPKTYGGDLLQGDLSAANDDDIDRLLVVLMIQRDLLKKISLLGQVSGLGLKNLRQWFLRQEVVVFGELPVVVLVCHRTA
jgi:hypothetical protein